MHKYTKKYKTIKESIKKNAKPTEGLGIYSICRKRQIWVQLIRLLLNELLAVLDSDALEVRAYALTSEVVDRSVSVCL